MSKKSNYVLMDEISTDEIVNKLKENSNCKNLVVKQESDNISLIDFDLVFYKYKITIESNKINTEAKLKKMWFIINICCYSLAVIFIVLNVIYPIVVCVIITLLMYIERKDFDELITNNFRTLDL